MKEFLFGWWVQALFPVLEGMLEDLDQQQRLLEDQDKSEQFVRCTTQESSDYSCLHLVRATMVPPWCVYNV